MRKIILTLCRLCLCSWYISCISLLTSNCAEDKGVTLSLEVCQKDPDKAALKPLISSLSLPDIHTLAIQGSNLAIKANNFKTHIQLVCTTKDCLNNNVDLNIQTAYKENAKELRVDMPSKLTAGGYELALDNGCSKTTAPLLLAGINTTPTTCPTTNPTPNTSSNACEVNYDTLTNQVTITPPATSTTPASAVIFFAGKTCTLEKLNPGASNIPYYAKLTCPTTRSGAESKTIVIQEYAQPADLPVSTTTNLPVSIQTYKDASNNILFTYIDLMPTNVPKPNATGWTYYDATITCRKYGYNLCNLYQLKNITDNTSTREHWIGNGLCTTTNGAQPKWNTLKQGSLQCKLDSVTLDQAPMCCK